MKTRHLIYACSFLLIAACSKDDNEPATNQAPGSFTVTPTVNNNSVTLNWTAATDPEGMSITYSVELDEQTLASDLTATSYTLNNLAYATQFSGKVIAFDNEGLSSRATYGFTTAQRPNTAPTAVLLSAPGDNEQSVSVRTTFTWQAATDAENDAIVYDVYLDESSDPMTKIAEDLSETAYSPNDRLKGNTTYYWKVIARDALAAETTSTIGTFKTGALVNGEAVLQNAPFDPRYTVAATFDNKMWVIGGTTYGGTIFSDLWSSSDGVSWAEEVAELPFGRISRNAFITFKDKLWVIGGSSSPYNSGFKSEVWSTVNGTDWKRETDNAAFGKRANLQVNKVVVYNDALWLFGGTEENSDGTVSNPRDVWRSEDGINWTLVSDQNPGFDFVNASFVVFKDKIWKVGGYHDTQIYSTADGVTWDLENEEASFGYRFGYNTIVWDDKIWLISGSNPQTNIYSEFPDVWYSENGKDWSLATDSFLSIAGPSLTVHNDKIWVIAGGNGFGNSGEYNHVFALTY